MKILILGYLVPDELIEELCRTDRMPSMQTHRYLKGLAEALDSAADAPVDLISALPTNDYPHGPRLAVGFRRWSARRNGVWWSMPFINVFPLKHLTRFASGFLMAALWCIRHLGKKRCIVIVSAATPGLTAGWLAGRLFGAKVVPLLLDPPSVELATDGGIKSLARRLDRWIAVRVLARVDATIGVTEPLARLFSPARPIAIFEGTAPALSSEPPAPRQEPRFAAAYAGALGRNYGIPALLDAYALLDPSQHVLWLFGKGEGEEEVRQASLAHSNIEYFGFLTGGLDARLRSADLLLMVRPSEGDDSAYCFPSKIHYSMALGVPTAVTRLKGLGPEYFEHSYLLEDSSPQALADSIDRIREVAPEDRKDRAGKMVEFVRDAKSAQAAGGSLYRWLKEVTEGPKAGR